MRFLLLLAVSGCLVTSVEGDPELAGGIEGIGVTYHCEAFADDQSWEFSWCAAPGINASQRVVDACVAELGVMCVAWCSSRAMPCPIRDYTFPPEN